MDQSGEPNPNAPEALSRLLFSLAPGGAKQA
jgi:hypothetical protein